MPLLVQRNAGAVRFDSCERQKCLAAVSSYLPPGIKTGKPLAASGVQKAARTALGTRRGLCHAPTRPREAGHGLRAPPGMNRQLQRLAVERRPEACLGCGFENGCSLHGCAVLRRVSRVVAMVEGERGEEHV